MLKTASISTKVTTGIVASLLLILGTGFYLLGAAQRQEIHREESARIKGLARVYLRGLRTEMKTGDPDDVRDFLREMLRAGDASASEQPTHCSIASAKRRIVWDTRPERVGTELVLNRDTELAEQAGRFSLSGSIIADASCLQCHKVKVGETLGYYRLERSTRDRDAQVEANRRRLLVVAGLLVLLLAAVSVLLVRYVVIRPLGTVAARMQVVAHGDLSGPPIAYAARDEVGHVAASFNAMLANLRRLIEQITATTVQLNAAAAEFQASAEEQERGALVQSTAVEEHRRTMDTLLESARQIGNAAQGVVGNAEKTQENARMVAEHIAALASRSQRILEILQVIKEISSKTDILALNAALEGAKAGEVGRGFSLVANQMQRLAESVMASVKDIKELAETFTEATRSTIVATNENTSLAADTTRSARQIVMNIHQQQAGTEQVTKAMEDVALVARETATGSREMASATKGLVELSEQLQTIIGQFKTEVARAEQQRAPTPRPRVAGA